jgi:adenylate cyclase
VNLASRLERQSMPGQIQVSETYHRLRGGYRFEARGPIDVRGIGEIATYFLIERNSPQRPPPHVLT